MESVIKAGLDGEYIYLDLSGRITDKLRKWARFGRIRNLSIVKETPELTVIEFTKNNTKQRVLYYHVDLEQYPEKYEDVLKKDGGYDLIYFDYYTPSNHEEIYFRLLNHMRNGGITGSNILLHNMFPGMLQEIKTEQKILMETRHLSHKVDDEARFCRKYNAMEKLRGRNEIDSAL